MTQIQWNSVGSRSFDIGVDRGVLYLPDAEIAVPWNGLISVEETQDTVVEPLYFNGVKYHDHVTRGDYKGVLRAYTYPQEFERFDGVAETPSNGIFVTGQLPQGVFHLSYRTMIGNDVDGINAGYKIHVLYNLTAKPSMRTIRTMDNNPSAAEFAWELSSVPVEAFDLLPTSHIIFDTTKMHASAIHEVEQTLYGSTYSAPTVVSVAEFETMATTAPDISIVDNGDGTWTATGSDYYLKSNERQREFVILGVDGMYIDEDTFVVSTTE